METFNAVVALISGFLLLVGPFSERLRQSPATTPLLALILGILLQPFFSILDIGRWAPPFVVLEEAARLTLAIGLTGTALALPRGDILRRRHTVGTLLGILMPLMWGISAALVWAIAGVPFLVALLAGAAVTPTDPILAQSVAEGELARRNIPARIRYTLLGESGPNDGLGFPFVMLPVALLPLPRGEGVVYWVVDDVLLAVGGAVALGIALGYAAGRVLAHTGERGPEPRFVWMYPVIVGLFSLAAGKLLNLDGVLAVFVAGVAFVMACSEDRDRQKEVQGAIDLFFSVPVFILVGLALPWHQWWQMGWRAPALAAAVLLFRRLPAMLLLWPLLRRDITSLWEAAFIGWFGPMGVSALFYGALAARETGRPEVWPIVSLIICSSVVAHGLTGAALTRKLGRWERREHGEIEE